MSRLNFELELSRMELRFSGYWVGLCMVWNHQDGRSVNIPLTAFLSEDARAAAAKSIRRHLERA